MLKNESKFLNLMSALSLGLFFLCWEVIARFGIIDKFVISAPSEIGSAAIKLLIASKFWINLFFSLRVLLVGFTLATVAGLLLAFIMGLSSIWQAIIKPYIFTLNSLPVAVLLPLFVVWFGIGDFLKILIVFIFAFLPICINTFEGIRSESTGLHLMAKSLGLSRAKLYYKVVFPQALPYFFAGLKIAAGRSVLGLVISEVYGYGKGLGYLVSYYGSVMQIANLMAMIFCLIGLNYFFLSIIAKVEKNIIHWN